MKKIKEKFLETIKELFWYTGVFHIIGLMLLFEYIIFPGLTINNTLVNLLTVSVGIVGGVYLYYQVKKFLSKK
jgi:hypothetical protein